MEAVIAAEAEDLAAPLHGTHTLPAGLAEQNMAQGKAASPSKHLLLKCNLHRHSTAAHLTASLIALHVLLSIMRISHTILCTKLELIKRVPHCKGQQADYQSMNRCISLHQPSLSMQLLVAKVQGKCQNA